MGATGLTVLESLSGLVLALYTHGSVVRYNTAYPIQNELKHNTALHMQMLVQRYWFALYTIVSGCLRICFSTVACQPLPLPGLLSLSLLSLRCIVPLPLPSLSMAAPASQKRSGQDPASL